MKRSRRRVATRVTRLALVTSLVLATSTLLSGGLQTPAEVRALAGTPGVPGLPTFLFTEDFENNGSTTVDPPVLITGYTGATGQTYSASPFWASSEKCNGMILSQASAPATPPATLCAGVSSVWNALKYLSGKLSRQFGDSGDQFTVASYTAGASGTAPDDYLQLETNTPIALPAGGAYLTVSIDTGANNCNIAGPEYYLYLTDASGTRYNLVSAGINPCLDPDAILDTSVDGRSALLVRTVGDAPQLIDSTSVLIEVENHNVTSGGNDATFDNIQLLDVSPQLDKEFETPVPYGSTSTITFTVTNTYSPNGDGSLTQLDPKVGWNFTDQLPAGLTIVGTPTTGTGPEACANLSSTGTTTTLVNITGDLSSDQAYCTVLVEVAANAPGTYTNLASSVSTMGVMPPNDATVTFAANPAISLLKSSSLNDNNTDGVASVGDSISYTFLATNTGNVPLVNTAITDPLVGAVTCASTSIPVGGSVTCTADGQHQITQAEVDAGQATNTASVTAGNSFNPSNTAGANDTEITPLPEAPSLSLVKTAATPVDVNSSGLVDAGDTIQYSFVVTNTGNVTVDTIAVSDPTAGSVTCDSTTLAPGSSATCTASAAYTITESDETTGSVVNTASASGQSAGGTAVTSPADSTTTAVSTPAPSLVIVKSADAAVDVNGSGLVDSGDTIRYRFVVTNSGNVPVSAVAVTDDLAGAVTCDASTLAVGAFTSCVADAPYVVTNADEVAGTIVNTASASALDPDSGSVTSPADSTTSAVSTPAPSLVIVKSADAAIDVNGSGLVDAGDTIRYRFVVTNSGNVPISDVTVTDDLAGAVTCDATYLAVGASASCVAEAPYVVTNTDEAAGTIVNTASGSGLDPDGDAVTSPTDSVTSAVSTPAPSIVIAKSADTPVDVNASGLVDAGDTIQYRFVVTNNGNVPVSGVAVNDPRAGAVTCDVTSLAVGASTNCTADAPYAVTEADEAAGSAVNTASASALDPDNGALTSNSDSTSTAVATPAPSLVISKSADTPVDVNASALVDAGDTIQYRFVVTNNGNVPISGVAINDDLVTATCESTTLAVGASTNCTASTYTITEADETAGAAVNTATATGLDPDLGAVESAPDATSTAVATPAPSLVIDKSAGAAVDVNASGLTDAGDTILYRFVVTNNGNVPLTDIGVDDPRAGTVTCADVTLAVGGVTNCVADASYMVTEADEVATAAVNIASGTGVDPDGGGVTSPADSTSTPVSTPAPELSFTKTAGTPTDVNSSGITDGGDTIAYSFGVTNTGNVPISNLVVDDPLIGSVTCAATTLAVGGSTDCIADSPYTITVTDQDAGAVDNTASASGADPDDGAVTSNADSTSTPVITPAPSLELTKTAEPPIDVNSSGITDAGDTIIYTFTVTNTGNVPIDAITIDDPTAGAVTCDETFLAPAATTNCVVEAAYVVTESDETAATVDNSATAFGRSPDNDLIPSNTTSTSTPVDTPLPSLAFDKLADPPADVNASGMVDTGDTIQYRFVVTNDGNVPVNSVSVSDDLAGSVTCGTTSLAVGEATTCSADQVYVVTPADEQAGSVENTASATGVDPDTNTVISPSDTTLTAIATPAPSLSIVKSADAPVDVNASGMVDTGDTIQYRFVVTNTGNVPLSSVSVSDDLAGSVTCDATTLAVGASTNCVADAPYVITEADEVAGSVVNTATASGIDPDGLSIPSIPSSTTTAVDVPAPSLVIDKIAETPVDVNASGLTDAGDTIQYRFVVANNGNVPVTGVAVNDDLVGAVTCSATTLAVGESTDCAADATYVVTEADEAAGTIINTATGSGLDPDGGALASNPDSTETAVSIPAPSLLFDKIADAPVDANTSGLTDAGDTIQYRFLITNTGNVPVTGVAVSDDRAGAVTCSATTVAVGESIDCAADAVYTITADDETAAAVLNIASASGVDPDDAAIVSNVDSTTTAVADPAPALMLDKTADTPVDVNASGLTDAGDTIQYRFVVTNDGDVPVSNLDIDDPLAGSVTCDSTALAVGASTNCAADAVYVVTEGDERAGAVINTATASASEPSGGTVESVADSTTTSVSVPGPSLLLEKFAAPAVDVNDSGLVDAGDTIRYSFTVTNNGTVPITSIKIDDPLIGSVTCSPTSVGVGDTVDCAADATYSIAPGDHTAGAVNNTASASGVDPDGDPVTSNESSTATQLTTPEPSLSLEKQALTSSGAVTAGPFIVGDPVYFRFIVTNTGNVKLHSLSIEDPMIGTTTCEDNTLAARASTVCTAEQPHLVTLTDLASGTITNTATVIAAGPTGEWNESSKASVTVNVVSTAVTPDTGAPAGRTLAAGAALLASGLSLVAFAARFRGRVAI